MEADRLVIFAREVPPPVKGRLLYMVAKWEDLDAAIESNADVVGVAFPEVLGDDYYELVVNLGKIADSGKALIVNRGSPFVHAIGPVAFQGPTEQPGGSAGAQDGSQHGPEIRGVNGLVDDPTADVEDDDGPGGPPMFSS